MTTSTIEKTGKIFSAIPAIMGEIEAIGRERKNQQQGFMYRGIDDVYNALQLLLAKHGVFTAPTVLEDTRTERQSKSGGILFHVVLKIQFRFYATDGSYFDTLVVGEGMDSGDKASNKAESVAHKYALIQVFAIRTEDNADPDAESHEVQGNTKTVPQPQGVPTNPAIPRPQAPAPGNGGVRRVSDKQAKFIYAMAMQGGWKTTELDQLLQSKFGSPKTSDVPAQAVNDLLPLLKKGPNAPVQHSGEEAPPMPDYDPRQFAPTDDEIPF